MVRKQNKRNSSGTKEIANTEQDQNIKHFDNASSVGETQPSTTQPEQNTNPSRIIDIGLDASTTTVGICVLDNLTGDLIELTYLDLSSKVKYEDLYDKIKATREHLKNLIISGNYTLGNVFIEEAAKMFSAGFSSADTLFTLAKFNHSICQFFYDVFDFKPIKINVRTARKQTGVNIDYKDKTKTTKQKVFDMVKNINPSFPWFTYLAKAGKNKGLIVYGKQNEDLADAWVIAKGGHLAYTKSNNSNINTLTKSSKK